MKRWLVGTLVAYAGIAAASAVLVPVRTQLSIATPALVLAVPVVAGVAVGGLASGVLAVAAGFVAYDLLFIPPYGTLTVGAIQNWTALAVYAVVMLIVARVVAFLQRARAEARHNEDATRRLYLLSDLLIGDQPAAGVLAAITTTIHQAFGARWVAVLIPEGAGAERLGVAATAGEPLTGPELAALTPAAGRTETLGWHPDAAGRRPAPSRPWAMRARRVAAPDGVVRIALSARSRPVGMVALAGAPLGPHDVDLLRTYANQAALALERSQLREQALRTELLEQVDELRAALMGAVSHDLRTPLASVKAAVSALRRAEEDGQPPLAGSDRRELLSVVEEQSDALDRLVANLLDMTRIQSGALELRRAITPVTDVVDGALRASAVPPEMVVVDVPADVPPADIDVLLYQQVVANLLDNAARHSPDGGKVRVAAVPRGEAIELSVEDEGPGVAVEDRERIFTMFSRSAGAGRAGLGLAIAKAFVDAHGQQLRVEDAPSGGARFVVTLPAAPVLVEP